MFYLLCIYLLFYLTSLIPFYVLKRHEQKYLDMELNIKNYYYYLLPPSHPASSSPFPLTPCLHPLHPRPYSIRVENLPALLTIHID